MNSQQKKEKKADLMLVGVTLCWGLSYLFMDRCFAQLSPFMLTAYRFLGAFLTLLLFSFRRIVKAGAKTVKAALLCSLSLTVTYLCATYGTRNTTLSNAGFLCASTSIFVTILTVLVFRKRPELKTVIAVAVGMIGMALLTLKDDFSLNGEHLKGDLLCIGCGLFYAVNLLTIERTLKQKDIDPFALSAFQMGFVGLFNLVGALVMREVAVPGSPDIWGALLFLTVFSTGIAFVLQVIAQKNAKASHAAVIFCLEPVFAAIAAALFANEVMTAKGIIGAVILLISIIILEC